MSEMTEELDVVMVVTTAGKTCMNKQNHSLCLITFILMPLPK